MEPTPPTHPQVDPPTLGEFGGHVIYPMPAFARVATPDVARLAAFFTGALDFGVMYVAPEVGGVPMLVHLRRAKFQDVLVVPSPPGAAPPVPDASVVVTFQAGEAEEIDALARRIAGVAPSALEGPVDTPWGTRDLTVTDPDGHRWTFTARGREPRTGTLDETMREAARRVAGD